MKCPKCGALIEDGKNFCFMCGTNINNVDGFSSPSQSNSSDDGMFGSASSNYSNNRPNNDFNPSLNNDYYEKKEAYNNRLNDYKNVSYDANTMQEKKDIFDIFSEHKTIIKIVSVILLIIIIAFAGKKYYEYKTAEPVHTPVMNDLYFEVDDYFKKVSDNQSQIIFAQSGNQGNSCSITLTYGTGTSANHVDEYYETIIKTKDNELYDEKLNVIDPLNVPLYQDNEFIINDNNWYFLYEYYRTKESIDYTNLKYRYLSTMYKGFYYDITLINNDNNEKCNLSLDKFTKTLEFINPEESGK